MPVLRTKLEQSRGWIIPAIPLGGGLVALRANGDEWLYERGAIATNLPPAELNQRGCPNERAKAVDLPADFSQQMRQGVPGTEAHAARNGGKAISTNHAEARL